ncbi:chromate transporter [Xylophilus sp.]|uniref:chromate transporter n=1 Tax=Xylophilus sp. TaxID=2653893 RepID=UPI0013BB577B|nr:chromate transporter [Xylophilus sp.]KAF1047973.1 MAG: Chromate transport protein [Xylophilus sp.]
MPSPPVPPPAALPVERLRPHSLPELFIAFTLLALQGFGGVLAVVQRVLVEQKRWMTDAEFIEDWAVAQVLPGLNVVNLAVMLGDRYFGLRGSIVAVAGLIVCPLALLMVLAMAYARFAGHPSVAGTLRGMGAVAAGLITATGLKLLPALRTHPLGVPVCAVFTLACFAAMALWRLPLGWVVLALGLPVCFLTWRKLG